jgi:FixJ family two-component response regulator
LTVTHRSIRPLVHLVDDDPAIRRALGRLLEAVGYEVQSFASAEDYLARPRGEDPACLVLDVSLPGIDGPGLHARLRRRGDAPPVVYVTAHDDDVTRSHVGPLEPAGSFAKPVDVPALLGLLRRIAPAGPAQA